MTLQKKIPVSYQQHGIYQLEWTQKLIFTN